MYIVLNQIIVGAETRENVLNYLNKATGPVLDYSDPDIFDEMDIEEGIPSTSQLFERRATQLINEHIEREPTRDGGVIILDDIPAYTSNPDEGEPLDTMSLKGIVTGNQDIFVVSVQDHKYNDQETYWMGFAYLGANYTFMDIIGELGIDIKEAFTGELK